MNLGKLTAHILICVSISFTVSGDLIISASAAFAQERRPLSVADVETLLKGGVSDGRIAELIRERGVDFEAMAAVRTRLKSAGAGTGVMQAAEKASEVYVKARKGAQPPKPAVDPERTKLEEENRKLREALKRAEAPKIAPAPPPPQTTGDGAEMVSVPAGDFWMGSEDSDADADEKPRRRVYLDAFRTDMYEVTNALYRRFMEVTGRVAPSHWSNGNLNSPQHLWWE